MSIKIKLDTHDKIKEFIGIARSFMSDIDIVSGKSVIDGKSVLGLYALDLSKEVEARLVSDNVDEIRQFDSLMEKFR